MYYPLKINAYLQRIKTFVLQLKKYFKEKIRKLKI